MIGKTVAVFTAIEVKVDAKKASSNQADFIKAVAEAGGIAGVARSEHDAELIMRQKALL